MGFFTQAGKAATIPEAAYRFCRHELGIQAVSAETSNVGHLKANVTSLLKLPLTQIDLQRLEVIFGWVDSISGN